MSIPFGRPLYLLQLVILIISDDAIYSTPIDTSEYFMNFSNVSQLIQSRTDAYNSETKKNRESVDEVNALLFHQFLWVMWTSGAEHVDEIAVWEVAFKLIEICRRCAIFLCSLSLNSDRDDFISEKSRFANAYFYAGNDWKNLLHEAVAKKVLESGPLLDILLEGAPRKHEGYDSFVEKKFPCVFSLFDLRTF